MEFLNSVKFLCPKCSTALIPDGSHLSCHKCSSTWAYSDEVLDLATRQAYWNVLSKEEMDGLIEQAHAVGWSKAIRESASVKVRQQYLFTDCPTRADPTFYLKLTKNSTVLDVGAGWGNFAFAMSPRVKEFVAADISIEPLRFIALRAKQDGRQNILPVHIDPLDRGKLPFAKNTFDAVILNGVLEWVASSTNKGDPLWIQLKALKEIKRVLKHNGQVFIGIENRFGFKYFFGSPDDHLLHYAPKGLPYTTIMPRFLASLITLVKLKMPYRTYTHSLGGYERLLKMAGFKNVEFYWPDPDYRAVTSKVVPLASKDIVMSIDQQVDAQLGTIKKGGALLKTLFKTMKKRGLERWFCNSYLITGDKI